MMWNETPTGYAQEQYIPQLYPNYQVLSSPRPVVAVRSHSHPPYLDRRLDVHRTAFPISNSNLWPARSAMPPKRNSSRSPSGTPVKVPKTEQKPEDFSNSVKKRLQSSTRTGQACDRCKVRKIRCDGLPGGCSPCLQNNTECRTTDRITGRAAPRGYVDSVEQQNRDLTNRVRELENLLIQHGIDFKPSHIYQDPNASSYGFAATGQNGHAPMWSPAAPSNTYLPPTPSTTLTSGTQETNMFRALPSFRSGCTGDNYLGVSSGNASLSAIKGTALSILGMEIDIADFPSEDMDEPNPAVFHQQLYNKSYQAYLQTSLNINPKVEKPKLPEHSEGVTYAQWFFRIINPFIPILHKPSFMTLLNRYYDDANFRPNTAQTVTVHMVFAIMFFQYATRNYEDVAQQTYLNNQSNLHYHYALGMFYQLTSSRTLQDVQALTLICYHIRNFPKPGASWILLSTTMSLAVECGFHRSSKRVGPENTLNLLEDEVRKRVFWSLLAMHTSVSGKLGRPMAFTVDDFDTEIPDLIDDELLSEAGLDTSRTGGNCGHYIGIELYRLIPLFMEMYSTIYSVRRSPETYIETVNSLEAKIRAWSDNVNSDIARGVAGSNAQESRIFALYAEAWALEFRLLLRHPSVSMTADTAFNAESMKICVDSARQMLAIVKQIQSAKSFDTTWYNSAVYVMAITTTLFAQWEKRNETSAADLAALRVEMDDWLDIMGELGAMLGSGTRLREAVRVVTDGTLGLLSRNLQGKSNGYANSSGSQDVSAKSPQRRSVSASAQMNGFHQNYNSSFSDSNQASNNNNATYHTENHLSHQQTPYPAATQYSSYPDPPTNSSGLSYPGQDSHGYSAYTTASNDSIEAPLLAAFAAQASQVAPNNWARTQSHNGLPNSGSQAWQQWTSTMAGSLEPQDAYSASALMQLGGRDLNVADVSSAPMADMTGAQASLMAADGSNMGGGSMVPSWPLNIFDIGQPGSAS